MTLAAIAYRDRGRQWPFRGPAEVDLCFKMPNHPAGKPDVDKLSRAVLDALVEARIIGDDAAVVCLFAVKKQAGTGKTPGVEVSVYEA